jgi:hypothetical protein
MTANLWTFESSTNGTALTAALSWANPTGAAVVVSGTGAAAIISTTHAAHGTRAGKFTCGSTSGACYAQKTISSTSLALSMSIWIDTLPSSDNYIFWGGVGSSQRFSVELTATGALEFIDDTNTNRWNASVSTSPGTIPTGQWVRVELFVTMGATTGTYRLVAYSGDSTTPLTGLDSGTRTTQNTGPDTYDTIRYGAKCSTNTNTGVLYIDDFDYNETATGLIGPYIDTLATPVATVTGTTHPSSIGGTNGTATLSWGAVAGAASYDVCLRTGTVTTGFTATASGVSSPYTFTGLSAGTYTVAVRAKV